MDMLATGIFCLGTNSGLNRESTVPVIFSQSLMARAVRRQSMIMMDVGGQMVRDPQQPHHIRHDHQAQDRPGPGRVDGAGSLGHDSHLVFNHRIIERFLTWNSFMHNDRP
jgi:hypothetical protein